MDLNYENWWQRPTNLFKLFTLWPKLISMRSERFRYHIKTLKNHYNPLQKFGSHRLDWINCPPTKPQGRESSIAASSGVQCPENNPFIISCIMTSNPHWLRFFARHNPKQDFPRCIYFICSKYFPLKNLHLPRLIPNCYIPITNYPIFRTVWKPEFFFQARIRDK